MRALIGGILGLMIIIGLVVVGADSHLLQDVGNIIGNAPLIGPMINAIAAFTKQDIQRTFFDEFWLGFLLILETLISNISDALFLGTFVSFADYVLHLTGHRRRDADYGSGDRTVWLIGTTLIGVVLLSAISRTTDVAHVILANLGAIALLLVAISIITRGRWFRHNLHLLGLKILLDTIATGGAVCFLGAVYLAPSMLRKFGLPSLWAWFGAVLALAAVAGLTVYASGQLDREHWITKRYR